MTARYTVQKGETAKDVAHRYTGDPSRYIDLIPVNPHLKTVVGQMGKPVFHRKDWHDGMSLKLPQAWVESGEMHGRLGTPRSGSVGCGCSNPMSMSKVPQTPLEKNLFRRYRKTWQRPGSVYGPRGYMGDATEDINKLYPDPYGEDGGDEAASGSCTKYLPKGSGNVKPYMFAVEQNILETIAKEWLGTDDVYGRGLYTWSELAAVNRGRLYSDCSTLQPSAGGLIYIPADWPACPAKWANRRRNSDGTVWTDGEPPAPVGPDGNDGIDRVNVTDGDDSSLLTWVLIGGAAVAAAVIGMKVVKKGRRR